jgi:4-amino-4-deoxy-L-arabinose transferase-like glycosyltransferase
MSAAAPPRATASARASTLDGRHRWAFALVGLFAVLAGAARAAAMNGGPLWYDETFSLRVIDPSGSGSLWTRLEQTESTPPLYYALSRGVRAIGVDGLASIRLVSVVAAFFVVLVAYWAAGRFFGPRVAVAAAALAAVYPMVSAYAIDGRSYELLLLLAFGFTGVLGRALVRADARTLAAWTVLAVLACWTHYFAAFLVVPAAVMLFVLRPEARRGTAVAAVVWALACVPLLALATSQSGDERAGFIGDTSLGYRVKEAARELLGGVTNVSNAVEALLLLLAVAGIASALLAAVRRGGRAADPDGPALPLAPEWVLAILAAVAIGVPLAVSVVSAHYDRFFGRNVIVALPAIILLIAAGLARRRVPGLVALVALCALMAVGSYLTLFDWPYRQTDEQGALRRAGPGIRRVPVLSDQPTQVVIPYLLERTLAPPNTPLTTTDLQVLLNPRRNGTRELKPVPIPAAVARLQAAGFTITSNTVYHGVRRLVLHATRPTRVPPGVAPPLGLYLPAPTTDHELQQSLLGSSWQ